MGRSRYRSPRGERKRAVSGNGSVFSSIGFTLLEILVATLIFLLIVTSLYTAYIQFVNTSVILEKKGKEETPLRIFQLRLYQELLSSYYNPQNPSLDLKGDHTSFSFVTTYPSLYFSRNPLTRLTYYQKEGEIWRREDLFLSPEENFKEFPVLKGITRWEVYYWEGEDWVEEWSKPFLPLRIKIVLEISGDSFQTEFFLPLGGRNE